MPVAMLEHEVNTAGADGLTTRNTTSIQSVTVDRSFLIKKMEITLLFTSGGDSGTTTPQFTGHPMKVVFFHSDGVATSAANAYDAAIQFPESHNDVIYEIPFIFKPAEVDDAGGWAVQGIHTAISRTKTFPKGYPMDKDDTYSWVLFNPSASTAPDPTAVNSNCNLRVRYWGVYL